MVAGEPSCKVPATGLVGSSVRVHNMDLDAPQTSAAHEEESSQDCQDQFQLDRFTPPVIREAGDYVLFDHAETNPASQEPFSLPVELPPLLEPAATEQTVAVQTYSQLRGPRKDGFPLHPDIYPTPPQDIFRVPDQPTRGSPNWAFGSPFFYSAQSFPWSQASVTASPMWHSAKSSPMVADIAPSNGRPAGPVSYGEPRVPQSLRPSPSIISRLPYQCRPSEYILAVQAKGLILLVDQELNWSGKTN